MSRLFFVAVAPPESIQIEIAEFKSDLNKRFGTYSALNAPAHITLFPPFRIEQDAESRLIEAIRDAVTDVIPFEIQLRNFDCFPPNVIFVNVIVHEELKNLERNINNAIDSYLSVNRKNHHLDFHPHITVGNRDWNANGFVSAWKEYEHRLYTTSFTVKSVFIYVHTGKRWETFREITVVKS